MNVIWKNKEWKFTQIPSIQILLEVTRLQRTAHSINQSGILKVIYKEMHATYSKPGRAHAKYIAFIPTDKLRGSRLYLFFTDTEALYHCLPKSDFCKTKSVRVAAFPVWQIRQLYNLSLSKSKLLKLRLLTGCFILVGFAMFGANFNLVTRVGLP